MLHRLSPAAALRLLAREKLQPSAASPLATPARPAGGADPAAVPREDPAPSPALIESIAIVARPDARVRVRVAAPNGKNERMLAYVAGPRAAPFEFHPGAIAVGDAMDLLTLVRRLQQQAAGPSQVAGEAQVTFPAVLLRTVTFLWSATTRKTEGTVPRADALARLQSLEMPEAEAAGLLERLAAEGLIEGHGDLRIAAARRPWLALAWSGHFLQIEYVHLPPDTLPSREELEAATWRLLFVGPPGGRVLSQTDRPTPGGTEGDEAAADSVTLSALAADGAGKLIRAALRLP